MHFGPRNLFNLAALGALCVLVVACKPTYPKCDEDGHCADKGEVCVNGQCQECRDDQNCIAKNGEGFECVEGRCEEKKECTTDADCQGLVCRGFKCVPECAADADCPSGRKCSESKCVAECEQDVDCGPNRACVDGGCMDREMGGLNISAQCRPMDAAAGQVVATEVVRFDFDQYTLTAEARSILDKNAECLKEAPEVRVVIEGHADDRGTQEYNLALGENRASAVLKYLRGLGIDGSRLRVTSKGENQPICNEQSEDCWAQNRRVEFIQSMQ